MQYRIGPLIAANLAKANKIAREKFQPGGKSGIDRLRGFLAKWSKRARPPRNLCRFGGSPERLTALALSRLTEALPRASSFLIFPLRSFTY